VLHLLVVVELESLALLDRVEFVSLLLLLLLLMLILLIELLLISELVCLSLHWRFLLVFLEHAPSTSSSSLVLWAKTIPACVSLVHIIARERSIVSIELIEVTIDTAIDALMISEMRRTTIGSVLYLISTACNGVTRYLCKVLLDDFFG
jgi:hypothetical protein